MLGAAIATYLTLFQWGVSASVWDPIFGSTSSAAVLASAFSRRLPVPDATLGALAYVVEALVTSLGDDRRWRTSPRLVIASGVVLAGLALTSIGLVLIQVLVVHALCTLCLCSAAISVVNLWLGWSEVLATRAWLRNGQGRYARGGA